MSYTIETNECLRCENCETICPVGAAVANDDEQYYIREEVCIDCGLCAASCPLDLITPPELDRSGQTYRKIINVEIIEEKCIGCSLCKKVCPVNAIDGIVKQPFTLDKNVCVRCGLCAEKCKKDAILIEY